MSVDGVEIEALSLMPRSEFAELARTSAEAIANRIRAAGVETTAETRPGQVVRGHSAVRGGAGRRPDLGGRNEPRPGYATVARRRAARTGGPPAVPCSWSLRRPRARRGNRERRAAACASGRTATAGVPTSSPRCQASLTSGSVIRALLVRVATCAARAKRPKYACAMRLGDGARAIILVGLGIGAIIIEGVDTAATG